jgi:hypothetical protein
MWKKTKIPILIEYLSNMHGDQTVLHKIAISALEKLSSSAIAFYLPQLFQCMRTETGIYCNKIHS